MATSAVKRSLSSVRTLADLLDRLGNIPLERVRFQPLPGTATERDVIAADRDVEGRLCELVDGVLVEKPMATFEAMVASLLAHYLWQYLETNNLGIVLGADGRVRLWRGLVRIPDVAFFSWDRLPEGEVQDEAIASMVPDLAVEILSPSNTVQEMKRKLGEYFKAGVRLAWLIDPKTATADVYTSPSEFVHVAKTGTLEGGEVLPGFSLPLRKLFSRKPPRKPRS